jgi:recombination protein RecR
VCDGIIQDLIDEFGRLPGIGPKSVERIAFHILQTEPFDVARLAQLLIDGVGTDAPPSRIGWVG